MSGNWKKPTEVRIILNARGRTGCRGVVTSCATIWGVVRVGREACGAGTLAPHREPSRVVWSFEWRGAFKRVSNKVERKDIFIGRLTVRAKVNTTQRNAAAVVIVDAHRQVVAIHERNCQPRYQKRLKEYTPSTTDYHNNQVHEDQCSM